MRRFRFYMTYTNARDNRYVASLSDGNSVHVRGWDAGVKVVPRSRNRAGIPDTDADEYDVVMTWGSNGGDRSVPLGTVRDTPDGPVWVPNEHLPVLYVDADATAPARLRKHRPVRYSRSRFTPEPHMTMTPAAPPRPAPPPGYRAGRQADPTVFGPEY